KKRFSHDFSLTTAYTWSHSIDQVQEHLISGSGSNSFLQNEHDLREQRGNSDFDFRQRLSFSYLYELPFGPGKHLVQQGPASHIPAVGVPAGLPPFPPVVPFRSSPTKTTTSCRYVAASRIPLPTSSAAA